MASKDHNFRILPKNCSNYPNLQTTSEHTFATVLTAAFDAGELPFQCPLLHIFDYVDVLQATLREGVIAPCGKRCAVYSILDETFLFQLLKSR